MSKQKVKKKGAAGAATRMRAFYGILAGVAVAGLVAIGYAVVGKGGAVATEPVTLSGVDDPRALYERAQAVTLGDPSAPVKVIEFGDFQCPACRQFALQIKPLLAENYIESGKVQFIYYDYPISEIHAHAFLAARAARCAADQGKFWEYHDLVFSHQADWSVERGAPVDSFVGYAAELGLDRDGFEACLRSDRHADVVTANKLLGQQLGVSGTPTVIINNKRLNNYSYRALAEVIDQEPGI